MSERRVNDHLRYYSISGLQFFRAALISWTSSRITSAICKRLEDWWRSAYKGNFLGVWGGGGIGPISSGPEQRRHSRHIGCESSASMIAYVETSLAIRPPRPKDCVARLIIDRRRRKRPLFRDTILGVGCVDKQMTHHWKRDRERLSF